MEIADIQPKPTDLRRAMPGMASFWILLGLGLSVSVGLFFLNASGAYAPARDALWGWVGAATMGLFGWWTFRRALSGNPKSFMLFLLGGMLVRLVWYGLYAGLAIGTGWVDPAGFVYGLLLGGMLFLGIEVFMMVRAAKQLALPAANPQGVPSRG